MIRKTVINKTLTASNILSFRGTLSQKIHMLFFKEKRSGKPEVFSQ
jgi:hypothetical protein